VITTSLNCKKQARTFVPLSHQQIQVLNASTSRDIDAAFATFVREQCDTLFFNGRRLQLSLLAMRYAVATYLGAEAIFDTGAPIRR
jgi:hypothetical protein